MLSATLLGAQARAVTVAARAGYGTGITVSGLADREVREAARRVELALLATGIREPDSDGDLPPAVAVHLGPSDIPKGGAALDLGIALEVARAIGAVRDGNPKLMALGELAIDGTLCMTRGVLALAAAAPAGGKLIVPEANLREATLARLQDPDLEVVGVGSLREALRAVEGRGGKTLKGRITYPPAQHHVQIEHVIGHDAIKEALLAAAVGGLHVKLSGPPGTGKSLMAKAAPSLLPSLSNTEALEVTRLWSITGHLPDGEAIYHAPYVAVDPNTSEVGLIGGGHNASNLGAVSRAHLGILHFDELQNAPAKLIDSLRSVLEDGVAVVVRSGIVARYPAKCQLIATLNPCPCGWSGIYQCRDCLHVATRQGTCPACGGQMESRCGCPRGVVDRTQKKISGPISDRFDVQMVVGPPKPTEKHGLTSKRASIVVARARQRLAKELDGRTIRDVPGYELATRFDAAAAVVESAIPAASLRKKHRTLKLALCHAALLDEPVNAEHVQWAAGISLG